MGQSAQWWTWVIVYAVLMNIAAYIAMAADKAFAKSKKRRIPEKTLFTIAFFGGALGMLAGMKNYRHKTKHTSFRLLIPVFLLVHCALLAWIWRSME